MHGMLIDEKTLWDKLISAFVQIYCVKFACDYDETRD